MDSLRANFSTFDMVYYTITIRIYIYLSRPSPDFRWAKLRGGVSGDWRSVVGRCFHRFGMSFWSADEFFVKANKLKVSLNDPPFFMTFLIGKASGDGRPMIDKQSADFGRKLQFETGRTLPAHQVSMLNCISIW